MGLQVIGGRGFRETATVFVPEPVFCFIVLFSCWWCFLFVVWLLRVTLSVVIMLSIWHLKFNCIICLICLHFPIIIILPYFYCLLLVRLYNTYSLHYWLHSLCFLVTEHRGVFWTKPIILQKSVLCPEFYTNIPPRIRERENDSCTLLIQEPIRWSGSFFYSPWTLSRWVDWVFVLTFYLRITTYCDCH